MNKGFVWVDLEGTVISPIEAEILRHKNTGGVLLFTKNYSNPEQLTELVQSIRSTAVNDVVIGVDHEGGRIWRFGEDFSCPPPAQYFGKLYLQDQAAALKEVYSASKTIAAELIACGIDLTFAPVLDINHGVSSVIGDRSFSNDPQIIIDCARSFIAGLKSEGMGSVGKHYPGHGGCSMDSHFASAVDTRSLDEILACDLQPFIALSNDLTAIMPAHVVYPKVDTTAAGFSKIWLQDILRAQLQFTGVIISDCLSMQGSGFAEDMIVGAEQALNAGCDMVIASQQDREYLLQVLKGIQYEIRSDQIHRINTLNASIAVQPI